LYPGLIKYRGIYMCIILEVQLQTFLNSILDGDEWLVVVTPWRFYFRGKSMQKTLKRRTALVQGQGGH